jgi:hypothetical protein
MFSEALQPLLEGVSTSLSASPHPREIHVEVCLKAGLPRVSTSKDAIRQQVTVHLMRKRVLGSQSDFFLSNNPQFVDVSDCELAELVSYVRICEFTSSSPVKVAGKNIVESP